MNHPVIGLIACTLLAGCGSSPPVQFFVLDTVHPAASPTQGATVVPIQVTTVHIPSALDRQEMVRESTSTQLAISDQHRWAAPLGEMAVRVLTEDLAARLPPGVVIFPHQPTPALVDGLVVDILQFDSDPSGVVTFDASWSLVPNGSDTPLVSRRLHLTHRAPSGSYSAQANAMSDALATLADTVAAALPLAGTGPSSVR